MPISNVRSATSTRRSFMLVVDNDEKNREYLAKLLERFQYSVCTAPSVSEALELSSVASPVLVVTAQRLQDLSGLNLITSFKKNPDLSSVPVIVLTDKTDPLADRACLAAGAVTCLSTPVSIEDLYRVTQIAIEPLPRMNMRIRTNLPVIINNRDLHSPEKGFALDLSEHGTYVRTDQSYRLKSVLPVQIRLGPHAVSAAAEVIYCRKETGGRGPNIGMGMQFVEISRPDQMRLRVFVRDEITRGIQPV